MIRGAIRFGRGILLSCAMAWMLPGPVLPVGGALPLARAQTLEFDGGETVFSQNSQYYYGQVGDFLDLGSLAEAKSSARRPDVGTASTDLPTLHLFVVASYFAYETPGPPQTTVNAYNGLSPAAGIRVPFSAGFWEVDAGVAIAQAYQTLTPIATLAGLYLQGEFYRAAGSGAMDLFATYTGYINYLYFQGRYLQPVWKMKATSSTVFLGPEAIAQGNSSYEAGQGGAVVGMALPRLDSYLTFDAGLLRSSVETGWGGYQGFSWYVSF